MPKRRKRPTSPTFEPQPYPDQEPLTSFADLGEIEDAETIEESHLPAIYEGDYQTLGPVPEPTSAPDESAHEDAEGDLDDDAEGFDDLNFDDDEITDEEAYESVFTGEVEEAEVEDELDEEEPYDEVTTQADPIPAVALRAKMTGSPYLSLVQKGGPQANEDALTHVLAAMGDIAPGETAVVRADFRAYPQFRQESRQWVMALKSGEEPQKPSRALGAVGFLFRFVFWMVRLVTFEATRNSRTFGSTPPTPPWRRSPKAERVRPELDQESKDAIKYADDKAKDRSHYELDLRVAVTGSGHSEGEIHNLKNLAESISSGFSGLGTRHQGLSWSPCEPIDVLLGLMNPQVEDGLLVSNDELAEIAHIPDDNIDVQSIDVVRSEFKPLLPKLKPPVIGTSLKHALSPRKGNIPIGILNADTEDEQIVGMNVSELDQHLACFGRTGTGKSELANWMIYGIAASNYPLVLLDPHGSLADGVLNMLAQNLPRRLDDIVLIDVGDEDFPFAFNPLDVKRPDQVEAAVKQVMQMLSAQGLNPANAPRATVLGALALKALALANVEGKLSAPNRLGLLHINRFLDDEEFRVTVMEHVSDLNVRDYFGPDGRFSRLGEQQQLEQTQVINRVFTSLANNSAFANVLATGNKLDWSKLIGGNKIVVVKMARFAAAQGLGEMLAQMLLPAILDSMNDWGRKRDDDTGHISGRGCRIVIDEAPAVTRGNDSVSEVLAEARKWDVGLAMFAQFPDQFDGPLKKAIFGNTASKITLALDPNNVSGLEKALSSNKVELTQSDISSLPNFHAYGSLLVRRGDGKAHTGPFAVKTLAPVEIKRDATLAERKQRIRDNSRKLVAIKRELAESRRSGPLYSGPTDELRKKTTDRIAADWDAPRNESARLMNDGRERAAKAREGHEDGPTIDLKLDQTPADQPPSNDIWGDL